MLAMFKIIVSYTVLFQCLMFTIIITGASYICQLLNVTCTLQVLHISGNNMGDEGMEMISQALQRNTQHTITELWVAQCGLSVKGSNTVKYMCRMNI